MQVLIVPPEPRSRRPSLKSPAAHIRHVPSKRAGPTRSCRPIGRRGGGAGALCSWCGRPREAMTPDPDWASRKPPALASIPDLTHCPPGWQLPVPGTAYLLARPAGRPGRHAAEVWTALLRHVWPAAVSRHRTFQMWGRAPRGIVGFDRVFAPRNAGAAWHWEGGGCRPKGFVPAFADRLWQQASKISGLARRGLGACARLGVGA